MLASKMKNIPEDMRERIVSLVEHNPDLFIKIAQEVKEEIDGGKDEMTAAIGVLKRHGGALRTVIQK